MTWVSHSSVRHCSCQLLSANILIKVNEDHGKHWEKRTGVSGTVVGLDLVELAGVAKLLPFFFLFQAQSLTPRSPSDIAWPASSRDIYMRESVSDFYGRRFYSHLNPAATLSHQQWTRLSSDKTFWSSKDFARLVKGGKYKKRQISLS
jgi:hypothetical protein